MSIVKEFERIRDIPYVIPLSLKEEDHCCSGKAKMFKSILESYGYKVRYRVCSFRRSDLDLPDDLFNIPHQDLSSHVYLEVFINDIWVNVDPTRDSKLSKVFQINEWDGISDTIIAVRPLELFDDEKSRKIMEEISDEEIENDLKINGKFYEGFNERLVLSRI